MNASLGAMILCLCAFSCSSLKPAVSAVTFESPPPREEGLELGLAEAAHLAVAMSGELEYRKAQLELRGGAWRLGLRAFFPSLRLDYGNDERVSLEGGDSFSKRLSLGISQLVWDGGRLIISRKLERAELDQAAEELRTMVADTEDAAVATYRSICAARMRLSVRLSSLERTSAELALIELKGSLGLLTPAEIAGARLKLSKLELEIDEERLRLSEAEAQLAQLLGMKTLPPLAEVLDVGVQAIDLEAVPLLYIALERSPALALARRSIERKRIELQAERKSWLPVLSIDATLGASGAAVPLRSGTWSVAMRISFEHPWIASSMSAGLGASSQGGHSAQSGCGLDAAPEPRRALGLAAAEQALRLEETRLSDAVASVSIAIHSAIRRYQGAARAIELARQSLSLAADGLALANLRAELGQAPASEVMDAELERAAQELALVDACEQLLTLERELERLLDFYPGQLVWFIKEVTK